MTPAQTKFVLDNRKVAASAAKRFSHGSYMVDFDDFEAIALLELCLLAKDSSRTDMTEKDIYWRCVGVIGNHRNSRAYGRVKCGAPTWLSLDALDELHGYGTADAIVHEAIIKFHLSPDNVNEIKERTHCKRGHALTPGNVYGSCIKYKKCRKCNSDGQRKRQERKHGKT